MHRTQWPVWLLVFAVLTSIQRIFVNADEERPRIHAAPTGFNAIDVGNGAVKDFLKIPGGYRDGFQKVIFEEVGPNVPASSPDLPLNDRFGAYDDNNVVDDNSESPLFIPLPYRNLTAEEKAEIEQKKQAEKQSRRGKLRPIAPVAPPRQPPIEPPTRTIISNVVPNNQRVKIRPPAPSVAQTTPEQPATRPTFVPQTRPNTFLQAQRPGFTPPPPKQPQLQQSSLRPQSPIASLRTTQTPLSRPSPPQISQQPSRLPSHLQSTTLPPQQSTQFRQLRPFRPGANSVVPQRPTSQTARPSSGLRSGICTRTIYYKPQEASTAELRQTYSHFAVVVSIDQCARTAFEFNSAQAIFDPTNRHCQFNPSTKFTSPQTCDQWPNPNYRNNLPITARAIVIRCITCQARRRTALRPFQRQNKALGINQVQFGPIGRSTLARRIQGVIINDNITRTDNEDKILQKALEAEQIVNFKTPTSIKTTNLEHLEVMKSGSSSAGSNEKTISQPEIQHKTGIIVHKLHPIETLSVN